MHKYAGAVTGAWEHPPGTSDVPLRFTINVANPAKVKRLKGASPMDAARATHPSATSDVPYAHYLGC